MWVKRCNEKLWVRTFSLIDGLSWLSWLISGKQAENLSVGKTKSYRTNNKKTPDGFVGHTVISGNLTKGFAVFTDTAHHLRPFFSWDAVLRLTWARMLLCGEERGNTAK